MRVDFNMQKKRKKVWKLLAATIIFITILIAYTQLVHAGLAEDSGKADLDPALQKVLENFPEYFKTNNTVADFGHAVAWAIAKGLKWLVDQSVSLYETALDFVDFTTYSGVEKYIDTLKVGFVAIFAVSLLGLGIVFIVDHEKKPPKILKSLLLMGLIISSASYLLATLNTGVKAFAKETAVTESVSDDIIKSSLFDLIHIDRKIGLANMKRGDLGKYHYTGKLDADKIDINEVINYKSDLIKTDDAKTLLGKKITYYFNDSNTYEGVVSDVYNGFGWNSGDDEDWFNEFYYRYKVDYFYIYISLVAAALVYILVSYKTVRMVIEIVTGWILGIFHSTNLNNSQKTVKILEYVLNAYIVILLSAVMIKVFTLGQAFIKEIAPYDDKPVVNCLLLLFLAFSIIDGPNLVQQISGIDAGLNSGAAKLIAASHMIGGVTRTAGSIGYMHTQHEMLKAQKESMSQRMPNEETGKQGIPPEGQGQSGRNGPGAQAEPGGKDASKRGQPEGADTKQNGKAPTDDGRKQQGKAGESDNQKSSGSGPMGQTDLDGQERDGVASNMQEKPPEMVDLDGDKAASPNDMPKKMDTDLAAQRHQEAKDLNGNSGIGIQNPTTIEEDGNRWEKGTDEIDLNR